MYIVSKYYLLKVKDSDFEKKSIYTCQIINVSTKKETLDIFTIKKENITLRVRDIEFSKEITEQRFNELIDKYK
ncbi:MAG TPA: hypothetical protein PL042_01780 [Caldisericia bacterium]|nr:hypothetical protein [Caldisericia bacterium]